MVADSNVAGIARHHDQCCTAPAALCMIAPKAGFPTDAVNAKGAIVESNASGGGGGGPTPPPRAGVANAKFQDSATT